MKKVLLSCMLLFGMSGTLLADDMKTYEPDQELTSVESLKDTPFAMVQGNKALYVKDQQNLAFDEFSKAFTATNAAVYYKLIEMPDEAGNDYKDYYLIRTYTISGAEYHTWGNPDNGFLNSQAADGWCSFVISAGANGHKYGQDIDYGAVWDVQYVEGEGFTLRNVGTGLYLNNAGTANNATPAYWTFCTLKESTVVNPIAKGAYDATDANTTFFAGFKPVSEGATYDPETKVFTKTCGWQWDGDGIDLSHYRYLVITAGSSREEAGDGLIAIKDNSGKTISGDDYGEEYQNMWFSMWNHLFCCKIDLEKLRNEKAFDIYHVKELTIDGGAYFMLGTAYATNQEPQVRNRWGQQEEGSVRITGLTAAKFGTVCLPYQAAVACAKTYEIAGTTADGITLNEVEGLLEAGKPYIYCTTKNTAEAATENKVFFYQATAATVAEPKAANGLIGTFTETTAPQGAGFRVISDNKLWTVDQQVTVGANKAYIDKSLIQNVAEGRIAISDAQLTGIAEAKGAAAANGARVYDLQGREVAQPARGIYLVNGKKIVVR